MLWARWTDCRNPSLYNFVAWRLRYGKISLFYLIMCPDTVSCPTFPLRLQLALRCCWFHLPTICLLEKTIIWLSVYLHSSRRSWCGCMRPIVLEFARLNCSLITQPFDTAWYLGHTGEAVNRRYYSITVSRMWLCQNLCSLLMLVYRWDHCNTQATKCSTQFEARVWLVLLSCSWLVECIHQTDHDVTSFWIRVSHTNEHYH